jgi:hypothetical protein
VTLKSYPRGLGAAPRDGRIALDRLLSGSQGRRFMTGQRAPPKAVVLPDPFADPNNPPTQWSSDALASFIDQNLSKANTFDDVYQFAYRFWWPIVPHVLGLVRSQLPKVKDWQYQAFMAALPPPKGPQDDPFQTDESLRHPDVLHCRSRADLPAAAFAYHEDGGGLLFDPAGCNIDPTTGWRIPRDCKPFIEGERRTICPGVPGLIAPHSMLDDFVKALAAAVEITAGIVATLFGGPISGMLVTDLALIVNSLDASKDINNAVMFLSAIIGPPATPAARGAHASMVATQVVANGIGQITQPQATAAAVYIGLRGALVTIVGALKNDPIAIQAIEALAKGACANVKSIEEQKTCTTTKWTTVLMAYALDFAKSQCPSLDSACLDGVISRMPQLETYSEWQLRGFMMNPSASFGLQAAYQFVNLYLMRPEALTARWQEENLSSLIPDAPERAHFAAALAEVKQREAVLMPIVSAAEGELSTALNTAYGMLSGGSDLNHPAPDGTWSVVGDRQAAARQYYDDAVSRANAKVKAAADSLNVAVPPLRVGGILHRPLVSLPSIATLISPASQGRPPSPSHPAGRPSGSATHAPPSLLSQIMLQLAEDIAQIEAVVIKDIGGVIAWIGRALSELFGGPRA